MKKVILDSSSAILLEKTELLEDLFAAYDVTVSEAVYQELTGNSYPSAATFHAEVEDTNITVLSFEMKPEIGDTALSELSTMGNGEKETIMHFLTGEADFIMLDDGKGARFCRNRKLPFINALLFPKILNLCGRMSHQKSKVKMEQIKGIGRYSTQILVKADTLSSLELAPFFP